MTVGTTIDFHNQDAIYHNVFSLSSGNSFDLGLYNSSADAKAHTFNEPGEVLKPGQKPSQRRMSFVDGGYVDNSGVATATKIARLLTYITKKDATLPAVDIKLIVISAAWIPFDRFWIDPPKNESLSEYVSPFVAAIAAWQGRGYTAQADVHYLWGIGASNATLNVTFRNNFFFDRKLGATWEQTAMRYGQRWASTPACRPCCMHQRGRRTPRSIRSARRSSRDWVASASMSSSSSTIGPTTRAIAPFTMR
jgi:hypothetical protein